jgi:hypothetical protein
MKKRSFFAMLVAIVGIVLTTFVFAQDGNSNVSNQNGGYSLEGENHSLLSAGEVNGVFVPE